MSSTRCNGLAHNMLPPSVLRDSIHQAIPWKTLSPFKCTWNRRPQVRCVDAIMVNCWARRRTCPVDAATGHVIISPLLVHDILREQCRMIGINDKGFPLGTLATMMSKPRQLSRKKCPVEPRLEAAPLSPFLGWPGLRMAIRWHSPLEARTIFCRPSQPTRAPWVPLAFVGMHGGIAFRVQDCSDTDHMHVHLNMLVSGRRR